MNRKLVLFLLLWISPQLNAQDTLHVFSWEEALKMPKDSIFAIDASRQKWDSVPAELLQFTKLVYLDLSKNRLTALPQEIGVLKHLRILDISRNKIALFPIALCQMTTIQKLLMSRNFMLTIPSCIGYFKELTYLDLWDNPIRTLPEELTKLPLLRTVDLRGILFNKKFQEGWRLKIPQVTWHFDVPCECID